MEGHGFRYPGDFATTSALKRNAFGYRREMHKQHWVTAWKESVFPEVTGYTHIVFLWWTVTPTVFALAKPSLFPGLKCVLCPGQFWRPGVIG